MKKSANRMPKVALAATVATAAALGVPAAAMATTPQDVSANEASVENGWDWNFNQYTIINSTNETLNLTEVYQPGGSEGKYKLSTGFGDGKGGVQENAPEALNTLAPGATVSYTIPSWLIAGNSADTTGLRYKAADGKQAYLFSNVFLSWWNRNATFIADHSNASGFDPSKVEVTPSTGLGGNTTFNIKALIDNPNL